MVKPLTGASIKRGSLLVYIFIYSIKNHRMAQKILKITINNRREAEKI
jgi:hypothetical protein